MNPPQPAAAPKHPFGHEIVFDNLVCAGFHQGLAGWYKREGEPAKAAIHHQLAEDFAANIIAIESLTSTQKSARAWTVANYLREKMLEAVNSKEWFDRYTASFGPFCKRFEEGVTEHRKN